MFDAPSTWFGAPDNSQRSPCGHLSEPLARTQRQASPRIGSAAVSTHRQPSAWAPGQPTTTTRNSPTDRLAQSPAADGAQHRPTLAVPAIAPGLGHAAHTRVPLVPSDVLAAAGLTHRLPAKRPDSAPPRPSPLAIQGRGPPKACSAGRLTTRSRTAGSRTAARS